MTENQKNQLATIENNLGALLKEKSQALPKDFNQTRFMQNCLTVLSEVENIEKMEPVSVSKTLLKGAFLDLDFFQRECYAIPYAGKLNFQTDYKGEIKICKKYSINPIKDIYAKLVREGDFFQEIIEDGRQSVKFNPVSFNDGGIIGAFAIVLYKDGSMSYETMSKKDIEDVRKNYSKAMNSPAWKNSEGEMYKKTVLRRLMKGITIVFENNDQQKAFEDGGNADFEKDKIIDIEAVKDPFINSNKDKTENKSKTSPSTKKPEPSKENDLFCQECGCEVTQKVADFSKSKLGKIVCYECQQKFKDGNVSGELV